MLCLLPPPHHGSRSVWGWRPSRLLHFTTTILMFHSLVHAYVHVCVCEREREVCVCVYTYVHVCVCVCMYAYEVRADLVCNSAPRPNMVCYIRT